MIIVIEEGGSTSFPFVLYIRKLVYKLSFFLHFEYHIQQIAEAMAYLHLDTYDIARASRPVIIPDSNIARLMYYLSVVCDLIECDDRDLDRLCDYRNYQRLTDIELRALFLVCSTLDPDKLIGKVLIEDEDGTLCGNSSNRIYELSQIRHNFLAVNSIFLAGRNRRVTKVMAFKPEWITTYYTRPMTAFAVYFQQELRREALSNLINTCTIS